MAGLRLAGLDGERRLRHWFTGTEWQGARLGAALAALSGARRCNCTFAGVAARAVSIPFSAVLGPSN